jgi:hypothetical protein
MYNTHAEIYTFYDKHVRLSREKQIELTEYRDTNLKRLREGLTKLGYPLPERVCGQGSYAMSTMVQHPDNDYDIDTAVIFASEDLPSSSLKARQRVLAGVEEGGGNFKQPPEARTNAVTVWYQDGHHIDLAVYHFYSDAFGTEVIEHAGAEWCRRDPQDITNWFKDAVASKSPSPDNGASVKEAQMRRIVQLLKMFAKSRPNWGLPGGLLISVLVSECYVADWQCDDAALYNTIVAICNRIQSNTEILNPVDPSLKLTDKNEHVCQVERFGERLGQAIDWLNPLFDSACDKLVAYKAWNKFFQHDYWSELVSGVEMSQAAKSLHVAPTGMIYTEKPDGRAVQSPDHRFFGDE